MNLSLLFTLLILGLFLAIVWAGTRLLIEVLAWVFRGFRPKGAHRRQGRVRGEICPNRQCRHVNPEGANFCARCGTSLRVTYTPDEL
jgi:hypothetical protein